MSVWFDVGRRQVRDEICFSTDFTDHKSFGKILRIYIPHALREKVRGDFLWPEPEQMTLWVKMMRHMGFKFDYEADAVMKERDYYNDGVHESPAYRFTLRPAKNTVLAQKMFMLSTKQLYEGYQVDGMQAFMHYGNVGMTPLELFNMYMIVSNATLGGEHCFTPDYNVLVPLFAEEYDRFFNKPSDPVMDPVVKALPQVSFTWPQSEQAYARRRTFVRHIGNKPPWDRVLNEFERLKGENPSERKGLTIYGN